MIRPDRRRDAALLGVLAGLVSAFGLAGCHRRDASANASGAGGADGGSEGSAAPAPPEELALLREPSWPSPPPSPDGSPITLRAVHTSGQIVLWAHGAPAEAKGLTAKVRFHDAANVIVADTAISTGILPKADRWYRFASVTKPAVAYASVEAQVYHVNSGSLPPLWAGSPAYGILDWRYPFPAKPPPELAGEPVGFAVLGKDVFKRQDDRTPKVVVTVGLYSYGDKPLTRVVYEVEAVDEAGTIGSSTGAWVPLLGEQPLPSIPPRSWVAEDVVFKDSLSRLEKATFRFRLKELEGPGVAFTAKK